MEVSGDPGFEERLEVGRGLVQLLVDTLTSKPGVKSYNELYTNGVALQFNSNLQSVLLLLSKGYDSEAWIIGRSMAEMRIRLKWVHMRKSNGYWMILGTEQADLNRFSSYKGKRSRSHQAAIKAIEARLASTKIAKGRLRHKTLAGRVRVLPNIQQMAERSGMVKYYRGFFKWGSDHTHASHRVLERFMVLDDDRNFTGKFLLNPRDIDLAFTSHHILLTAFLFLAQLLKYGWPVDRTRYEKLGQALIALRPETALAIRGGSA